MRDLKFDLSWLTKGQERHDLSDEYLKKVKPPCSTRSYYGEGVYDFSYGISFVESTIAREWLERAIKAEEKLSEYYPKKLAEEKQTIDMPKTGTLTNKITRITSCETLPFYDQVVLNYLQMSGNYISPNVIGEAFKPSHLASSYSAWASPICKRLVKKGYALRNDKGHYKAIVVKRGI